MSEIHQRILKEVIEEEKAKQDVESIIILGSVARNEEKPKSDVDIIIITKSGKWFMENKERYEIKIDFESCPKEVFLNRVKNYPFLCYIFLDVQVGYDSKGEVSNLIEEIKEYFKQNKKIAKFWQDKWKIKKELKLKGQDAGFTTKCFDEAEILFSKEHKITRNFFRGK